MAHATENNEWVDEVRGTEWKCSDIVAPYTIKPFVIKNDKNSRIPGKPYASLDETKLYTTNLIDNIIEETFDYTISVWVKLLDSSNFTIISSAPFPPIVKSILLLYDTGYGWNTCVNVYGQPIAKFNTPKAPINVWHHYAITRKNNITSLFIDGNKIGSDYIDAPAIRGNSLSTAVYDEKVNGNGHITIRDYDEIVVIKGQALWTENFNPSRLNFGYYSYPNNGDSSTFKIY